MSLSPHRLIIHHQDHLHAALEAGRRLGRTPTLQTPPDGIFRLGPGYLVTLGREADVPYIIDAADAAGYAQAVLRMGVRHLLFRGPEAVHARLAAIAQPLNAFLVKPAETTLDLLHEPFPLQAALAWLAKQP